MQVLIFDNIFSEKEPRLNEVEYWFSEIFFVSKNKNQIEYKFWNGRKLTVLVNSCADIMGL